MVKLCQQASFGNAGGSGDRARPVQPDGKVHEGDRCLYVYVQWRRAADEQDGARIHDKVCVGWKEHGV